MRSTSLTPHCCPNCIVRGFQNRPVSKDVEKNADIFLSYRVASDSAHVEAFHKQFTGLGLKVWWDKLCLLPGQNWEEGFCSGLLRSANFVCLLPKGAIRNPNNDRSNFEKLTASSPCDNVLLKWRLALELKERGMIDGVFPVMIGDKGADRKYSRFGFGDCTRNVPGVAVESVEHKISEHLDREGLRLPLQDTMTVSAVLSTVLSNKGGFIEVDFTDKLTSVCQTIKTMVSSLSSTPLETRLKNTLAKLFGRVVSTVHTHKIISSSEQLTANKKNSVLKRELLSKEKEKEDLKRQLSEANDDKLRVDAEKARIETENRTILDEKAKIETEKAMIEADKAMIMSAYEQENSQLRRLLEAPNRRNTASVGTADVVVEVWEQRSTSVHIEDDDSGDIELGDV